MVRSSDHDERNDKILLQVGMEAWARWAHRALWHSSLWSMHEVLNFLCQFFVITSSILRSNSVK